MSNWILLSLDSFLVVHCTDLNCFLQVQLLVSESDVENYKQIKADLDELRLLVEKSELWVYKAKPDEGKDKKKKKKPDEEGKVSTGRQYRIYLFIYFFKIFCRTQVLFVGPLIPLFWTSGDVCPGFQSQGGFPHLRASSPVHNGFLRFTPGVTPAFSTNSGVHCISVYTAWLARLLSHTLGFEPAMQW